jgi:hypothetical protein
MLTTSQVRAVIHKHTDNTYGIYTNKTKGHTGIDRRVKCYFRDDVELYTALQKAAGHANVYLTPGSGYSHSIGPAIIVRCVLG